MRLPQTDSGTPHPLMGLMLNVTAPIIIGSMAAVLCGMWLLFEVFQRRANAQTHLTRSTSIHFSTSHVGCQTENVVAAMEIVTIPPPQNTKPSIDSPANDYADLEGIDFLDFTAPISCSFKAATPPVPLDNTHLDDEVAPLSDSPSRSQRKPTVTSALLSIALQSPLQVAQLSDIEVLPTPAETSPLAPSAQDNLVVPSEDSSGERNRKSSVFDQVNTRAPTVTVQEIKEGTDYLLGEIHFSLTYNSAEKKVGLLLIEGVDLAAQDLNGKSDPYVSGCIEPQQLQPFTSKVIYKTLNPVWNEQFWFENIEDDMLSNCSIGMNVYDKDKLSKDDTVGKINVPLAILARDHNDNNEVTHQLWKYIEPCVTSKHYRGEILISLCYETKDQRILVKVHKAKSLKSSKKHKLPSPFCTMEISDMVTKRVERRRTTQQEKTVNPEWEYVFSYEVEQEKLDHVRMKLSVKSTNFLGQRCLGQITLAPTHSYPQQTLMWGKMVSRPDEVVTVWNTLHK